MRPSRTSWMEARTPHLVVASSHLTPTDAELLEASDWDSITKVQIAQDGFTISRLGLWTEGPERFELLMERLVELGHSESFIRAMRYAREHNAWNIRFDDRGAEHPDLPIGGYRAGAQFRP